jgi:hypothetical protein
VKISNVIQIINKPNSRVRFGIPASLLLSSDEEATLTGLSCVGWVASHQRYVEWGFLLFTLPAMLQANSLKHPRELYSYSVLLSESAVIS